MSLPQFEQRWSKLFFSIINLQHQVRFQREANFGYNLSLGSFNDVEEGLSLMAYNLVQEYKHKGVDSPIFEYFIKFDVIEQIVELALSDIPSGLLSHVMKIMTALLNHLPFEVFSHEKLSAPITKILVMTGREDPDNETGLVVNINDPAFISFFKALVDLVTDNPVLVHVFYKCRNSLITIFCKSIDNTSNFINSQIGDILVNVFGSGLFSELNKDELEDLFLRLVFILVDAFTGNDKQRFIYSFNYFNQIISEMNSNELSDSRQALIDLYRSHFVDRIFNEELKMSSPADGSLQSTIHLLSDLIKGNLESNSFELLIILLSKANKLLETKSITSLANHEPLYDLYGQVLSSFSLYNAIPTKKPALWNESSQVHRERLQKLITLVSDLPLSILKDTSILSDFYRAHLMAVEGFLGEGQEICAPTSKDSIPLVKELTKVIDSSKSTIPGSLYIKGTGLLLSRDCITMNVAQMLIMLRYLAAYLTRVENAEFYKEMENNASDSNSSPIWALNSICSMIKLDDIDDNSVEPLIRRHSSVDVFDPRSWPTDILESSLQQGRISPTLLIYISAHFYLRMAAIEHCRSCRPGVNLFYE